ncbi:MAG: hypothetical protein CR994_09050 [Maribacter sp.]|nr:MAG: hypothetical protein CR994_09050 [Maribacter sp.]
MFKLIIKYSAIVACITLLVSCSKDGENISNDVIFKPRNATTLEMNGVVNSGSLKEFNELYTANPTIKTIQIKECDGSMDDEVNLKLSKRVHDLGLNIHLLDNGLVASGGTDFFLAGIKRTVGRNTKFGVHSWAGGGQTATDFPVGHPNHQPYIDYYKSVGFSDADAKAFYYFTINAAPASGIHWMTDAEIETYKLLKD